MCLIKSFALFFYWTVVILLLSYESSLHILDRGPLSDACIMMIFPYISSYTHSQSGFCPLPWSYSPQDHQWPPHFNSVLILFHLLVKVIFNISNPLPLRTPPSSYFLPCWLTLLFSLLLLTILQLAYLWAQSLVLISFLFLWTPLVTLNFINMP